MMEDIRRTKKKGSIPWLAFLGLVPLDDTRDLQVLQSSCL